MQTYAVRFVHVDHDRRARPGETLLGGNKLKILGRAELEDFASAEEPDDACSALERAEHDGDPPVLPQVGDCLDSCVRCEPGSETTWGGQTYRCH